MAADTLGRRVRAGAAAVLAAGLAVAASHLPQCVPAADADPKEPSLVAPGIVSTGDGESHPALSPDGRSLYFLKQTPDFAHWTVVVSEAVRGGWGDPAIAWFSGRWDDADMSFSPDGDSVFFISNRPDGEAGAARPDTDLFRMKRTSSGWSPAERIAELSGPGNEWFPNQAANGTLYFGSERRQGNLGPEGTADLWRARWLGDRFAEPENLGAAINTSGQDIEPWVAPDESYLVFSAKGRPDSQGSYDFYVSYRCGGTWTAPRPLGGGVNSPAWDFAGRFSPDGKTFFFASNRTRPPRAVTLLGREGYRTLLDEVRSPGNGMFDIYSVDAAALGLASPCPAGSAAARPPGPEVRVPRAGPAVVDGRMDEAEWKGAARRTLADGSVLRLQHDGTHLFLGMAAAREGFPSVCASDGGNVRIFHASAALGSVTYSPSGSDWSTNAAAFEYGMRNPDLSERARAERRAYLGRNGWVASTVAMGGRRHELQIALAALGGTPSLALAYFASEGGGSIAAWPASLTAGEGCADERLVRGHVPPRLRFDPAAWAALRFD